MITDDERNRIRYLVSGSQMIRSSLFPHGYIYLFFWFCKQDRRSRDWFNRSHDAAAVRRKAHEHICNTPAAAGERWSDCSEQR